MAAPDPFALYDFETQLAGPIVDALVAALAGTSPAITCQVVKSRDVDDLITPRISIDVAPGAPLGHMTTQGQANPRQVPDAFDSTLTVEVASTRPIVDGNSAIHGVLVGFVRYYLSAGAKIFNGTNLPYLQVLEMLPQSSASGKMDNKEQDLTVLVYGLKFAIRPDAWPSLP